jgi:hypothetical protein
MEKYEEGEALPVDQSFTKAELGLRVRDASLPRPLLTPEAVESMDRELEALDKLMNSSDVWWQLEGSICLSALKGAYMGPHTDVDIVVLKKELAQLEKHLIEHGYGLFWKRQPARNINPETYNPDTEPSDLDDDEIILRSVDAETFAKDYGFSDEGWTLSIAAVGKNGVIDRSADLVLIDVELIGEDKDGKKTQWYDSVFLPDEWLEGAEVDFRGAHLKLSHPVRLMFIAITRSRDSDDETVEELLKLRPFTKREFNELEDANKARFEIFEKQFRDKGLEFPKWLKDTHVLVEKRMKLIEASIDE